MQMRKEEEIKERVAECLQNLRELAAKPDFSGQDFIIADRNVTTLSALVWALDEPPPEEARQLADSVLQKFRAL
jgi:hypothetical protein